MVNTPVRILIYFTVGFGSLHRKWKKISWCYLRPWYRAVMSPEKMCYVCSSNPGGMGVGRGDRRSSWEYIRGPCQFDWTMGIFRVCSCRHISSEWQVVDWPFTRLSLLIEKQKDPEKSQFGKGKTIFAGQTQLHVGLYWFFAPSSGPGQGLLDAKTDPQLRAFFKVPSILKCEEIITATVWLSMQTTGTRWEEEEQWGRRWVCAF